MEDKRNHQIVLPYEIEKREIQEFAKQAWNLTFAKQKKVSKYTKRIMAVVLAQIKKDDKELAPYYKLHVTDINNQGSDTVRYVDIKKAFNELTDLKWLIEDLEKESFAYRHLLNTSDINCKYESGNIFIVLNPILKDYFIQIAHYTTYEIKWFMSFTSWYSMRLFELLSAYKDTGIWYVGIDKFRELMDCKDKYKNNPKMLFNKVLKEPIEELSKTDLAFEYKEVFEQKEKGRRGRPSLIGIEFKLLKVKPKSIPNNWLSDERTVKIIKDLKKWKVSERNIINYLPVIDLREARILVNGWQMRVGTNEQIKNPLAYCNKVFSDMGKGLLADKKISALGKK